MGNSQSDLKYNQGLPNTKQSGFSSIYRNAKFMDKLTDSPDPLLKTYRDVIETSCLQKYSSNKLAGAIQVTKEKKDDKQIEHRSIQSFTFKECFDKAQLLGKAIVGHKLQYKETTQGMKFIGIYSKNRVEWLLTDMACTLFGLTTVPLYDTLGIQNLSYCLNQTQMTSIFLTAQTLKSLLKLKNFGNLKNVIVYDKIDQQTMKTATNLKFNVLDFQTLLQSGKKFNEISYKKVKVQPNDIYTFSYTSGTTGPPKGAMLSHHNVTSFLAAFCNHPAKFIPTDVYLSFLPLPHVLQRMVIVAHVLIGSHIVFYSGDMLKIKDDCQVVKPTVFIAVPRIFNRIVEKVQEGFSEKTGLVKCLVYSGLSSKLQSIQSNGDYNHGIYDTVVFSKVRDNFGGRIRLMITGSAPINKKTFQFMQILMSCPMYEGYGQTENTAAAFIRTGKDPIAGHVGAVVSALEFKLADIPQMKYTADDKDEQGRSTPRGQIWLRGPQIFAGYYKLKDKTDEALTKDGWLKTGDVGMLLPGSNAMKIIDRKKNIFKLQQGQYVAPEKVQIIYGKCPYVEENFLYGQSTQNYCVAIVKPHKQHFMDLAKKNSINGSYEQLCKNKQMKISLLKQLFALGKSSGLNSFQQAKNIYLEHLPFNDKNILTNTMKLQRFEAKIAYKQVIDDLYNEGEISLK